MFSEHLTILDLFSLVGGVCGFLIALTIMRPLNRTTFFGRFFAAIVLAFSASEPLLSFMGYPLTGDTVMLASTIIGAFGWFLFSVILKTVAGAKNFKGLIDSFRSGK